MNIDSREFHDIILNDGKVWLDEGYIFGEVGQGFERINIACPRVTLEEGLNRIKVSLEKAGKI
jgi:cystathionine beta-lyase